MNTLTVPKIKDLVNKPTQQYKDIFDTLQHSSANVQSVALPTASDAISDELSSFLSDLKKIPPKNAVGTMENINEIGYSLY